MTRLFRGGRPRTLAVALSGGGDSTALLALTRDWAGPSTRVFALIVDHRLRPESAEEAAAVAEAARRMGAAPVTLVWKGWDGSGNLQAEAREARYDLIAGWCRGEGAAVEAVLLGHTLDDQAETVLLRLLRGSGVDGLAGMSPGRPRAAPAAAAPRLRADLFLRPLLWARRADLRAWLKARGIDWVDDPSNEDERFDRVRARRALAALDALGLQAEGLARTAGHMARARRALQARAADVAADLIAETYPGILTIDRPGFAAVERETQLRLLAHGLQCLSGAPYRPRLSALTAALDGALHGRGSTLQGGQIIVSGKTLHLVREPRAVEGQEVAADGAALWDGRWRIRGRRMEGATIRMLGETGASEVDRPPGLPHAAIVSYPGLWTGQTLLAAPNLWHAALCQSDYTPEAAFHRTILSH